MTGIFFGAADLSESFQKMIEKAFIRVDGVLVQRTSKGFIVFGEEVGSMEAVKQRIQSARENLAKSIK